MKRTINPKIVCPSCGSPRKRPKRGAGVNCADDWHKRTRNLFKELMEGLKAIEQYQSRKKNED